MSAAIPKGFENYAFKLHSKDNISLVPHPVPAKPGPNDVLLRSLSTGICGTDIHYWKHMANGNIKVLGPMVLGHEASAEVVEVGSDVKHLKAGDFVTYEPSVTCLKCLYCLAKDYNLCENITQANPPYTGTLTYYFLHNADFTFKVPKHVTAEEAALIEPITVAVHACKRANVTVGSKVLITGAGPMGLIISIVARAYGATRVVVTDINEDRLKLARSLGVDDTILVSTTSTEQEIVAQVKQSFGGQLPTISFECSGFANNFRVVLLATKSHGLAMFVGMGPTDISLPVAEFANREVDIRTCHRYHGPSCYPVAIELVASGKYPFSKLVSHRFALKDALKAFEVCLSGKGVKVMINVGDKSPLSQLND